jgi:hypothetical protein
VTAHRSTLPPKTSGINYRTAQRIVNAATEQGQRQLMAVG